ncbi:C25 family cysteine peptidase [Aridibaculum aurantiacum]|uniref:putative type IX secretion system sortase PorU2 n=1 Tax=Aridibaculum aurantiacum TaxID=2810307 RepID=UPI001A973060|nr:C25 family cysteine peptidase [Aridibaculum aurantiacum]
MKRIAVFVVLLLVSAVTFAQSYYNEWIDYSKTYYRFKVGSNGLYRIPGTLLGSLDLAGHPAEHFQLWRNGKQVPIFTSSATGPLGTGGFIEFWGEMNDGTTNTDLYRNPNFNLNDKKSLLTDTAAYFLTVNPAGGGNSRFAATANNVTGNTLPAQPFFMHTARHDFMQQIHRGMALPAGSEYVYSSAYDQGEMWSSWDTHPANPLSHTFDNLFLSNDGPAASFRAAVAGSAPNNRQYRFEINNVAVVDSSLSTFGAGINQRNNVTLSGNTASVRLVNLSTQQHDRIVCSFIELRYPRQFNFNNQSSFTFTMPATASGQYLEIQNFRTDGVAPVLYDLTNNRRYVADVSTPGVVKVVLQPSSVAANLVLVSQHPNEIVQVQNLLTRTFVDYRVAANQGDYLIISHPLLQQSFQGADQVEAYRAYRNSSVGGGFTARIANIDQLVDQFGYGIKKNPLSVKNFLRFARATFAVAPKYAFLIGKGVSYNEYRMHQASPHADRLNIVPTWGYPASDVMLGSDNLDPVMRTGIGRLSVVSPKEVADYLEKIKQYEEAQRNPAQTIEAKAWMKNVVHVEGGNDPNISNLLGAYLRSYENIIKDTLFGANVVTFSKTTTGPVTPIVNQLMQQMFSSGISLLNYFGHSSATALDYNLEDPYSYNNQGKYPMFIVNGCNAGNMFSFDTARFVVLSTLTERFTLAKERGAIGFIASTHFGLTSYLDYYNLGFYRHLRGPGYGKSVSENMVAANNGLLTSPYGPNVMGARLHAEETTLHGDPAIKINAHEKPDFVVEEPQIRIVPNIVSVADLKFDVKALVYNIGKATGDSVMVQVKHQYPDGTSAVLLQRKIRSIRVVDSLMLQVAIDPLRDRGENKIIVTVDLDNAYNEMSETNNSNARTFVIQDNGLRPVYPVNFAIVNRTNIKLAASTTNPLAPSQPYMMEIDTTEFFNSPLKVSRTITSAGGLIEFEPGISFTDSTVYYWRVASVPTAGVANWTTSSFTYVGGPNIGYNQSHLFQHLKSTSQRMSIDSASRQWKYGNSLSNMVIINAVPGISGFYNNDYSISVNGNLNIISACVGHSVIFNVFDPVSMKPYYNQPQPATTPNNVSGTFMNSGFRGNGNCDRFGRQWNFEYSFKDTTSRRWMRDFMDWIPSGAVVTARIILDGPLNENPYVDVWKADQSIYGVGNTLYDRLKAAGFAELDSFNRPRTWSFVYKKNDATFQPVSRLSVAQELITLNVDIPTRDTLGFVTSPVFGPARSWKQVNWRGASAETTAGDSIVVSVIGIRPSGVADTLFRLNSQQQNFDISSVSATQYPNMRLHMRNQDSRHLTPYQLRYWRLFYEPVPEGALAANLAPAMKDSFEVGEKLNFAIAFKNISDAPFADSIRLRMILYDKNNVANVIPYARLKRLQPGDTAMIRYEINTSLYEGNNTVYLDVNPDFEQPEQYRFNNFLYKNFRVQQDVFNPLLDVTFDGVRILNGDIVSAKPSILVKLKDDSKFLALNDTALVTVYLKYPNNGPVRRFAYNTDTLKFIPADLSAGKNEAMIEFNPSLIEDSGNDFYELIVKGKDRAGNPTSNLDYQVRFQVINKPMISNMFNYPNPFTSSTAFVFTLTGSEVPQNLRIQIMTVTGKIVKEITKHELGPLNIGRNITEYKWDGTDQYGQQLANGIYLYRVITNHNGTSLEKYNSIDGSGNRVNTDKFFNNGYGKMYLMR